jgi:cytochrome c oxidase subunit IV
MHESTVAPNTAHTNHEHIPSIRSLLTTFATLIVLTVVTLYGSTLSLGSAEIWFSMGIASVKAALVALYFMHLKHDKPFNVLIVVFSLAFAAIFIGLTMIDANSYQTEINTFVESELK